MAGRSVRPALVTLAVASVLASLAGVGAWPVGAAFPGANGLLTFEGGGRIWGLDLATGSMTALAAGASPDWSPDGTRLVLTSLLAFPPDIVVVNADGTGEINLSDDIDAGVWQPSWAPDGREIVYQEGSGTAVLGIMSADGSSRRLIDLTGQADLAKVEYPEWSPGGDRIAFTGTYLVEREGETLAPYDIFTVAPDGSGLTQLTVQGDPDDSVGPSFEPEWSPDGTRIAFSRWWDPGDTSYQPTIWVMNADGSDQHLLVAEDDLDLEKPVWSPDGTRIAFTVNNGRSVRIVNADGSGVEDVSFGEGEAFTADWQPLP
jgi:dipeptidyl aminopeptidase/acylaminoacyl peptidase